MVVKINGKPLQVTEDTEQKVDWVYLGVSTIGYGLIFWIMWYAFKIFLGGF